MISNPSKNLLQNHQKAKTLSTQITLQLYKDKQKANDKDQRRVEEKGALKECRCDIRSIWSNSFCSCHTHLLPFKNEHITAN